MNDLLWILIKIEATIELLYFSPVQFPWNLLGSLSLIFEKTFQIWAWSRHDPRAGTWKPWSIDIKDLISLIHLSPSISLQFVKHLQSLWSLWSSYSVPGGPIIECRPAGATHVERKLKTSGSNARGHTDQNKIPRVQFFFSLGFGWPTYLRNQAHRYIW